MGNDELNLDQCWMAYQPIYDFENVEIIGYEALLRGPFQPEQFILEAVQLGYMPQLDAQIHRMAQHHFNQDGILFINMHPLSLHHPELFSPSPNVVLEITEHAKVDFRRLHKELEQFRKLGYKIAIDDFGSKHNKAFILDSIHPDFIKLDRSITRNIEQLSEFVYMVRKYSQLTGIQVIAEGIESEQEMHCLKKIGVAKGQGFYFGSPEVLAL